MLSHPGPPHILQQLESRANACIIPTCHCPLLLWALWNSSSIEKVAQWAGCSASSVVKATHHVIVAFLPLHEQAVQWPNSEAKCSASDWVESVSCHAWWPGFCMVDRTLIPLFSKLGHFGEQFFDCKSNYSLSLTVQVSSISWGLITNFFAACNIAKSLYHRLCAWTTGQHT